MDLRKDWLSLWKKYKLLLFEKTFDLHSSVTLLLFSLRLENFERRGLILTGVRGSYRKQAGPSLNNPMRHLLIHRSDRVVCREPLSVPLCLSFFLFRVGAQSWRRNVSILRSPSRYGVIDYPTWRHEIESRTSAAKLITRDSRRTSFSFFLS